MTSRTFTTSPHSGAATHRETHPSAGRGSRPRRTDSLGRFDLTISEVCHVLAYDHDHPEEMRAVEECRQELHEATDDGRIIITGPGDLLGPS